MIWSRSHDAHIRLKPFKNLFLWNGEAIDVETWHVELGIQTHHNLFKFRPWNDLDVFHSKVKFAYLSFWMGKGENNWMLLKVLKTMSQNLIDQVN